ncbi:MAG TPA: hypothetical protein PLY70_01060 [Saprospiraceae bacterium]|nr:hypothetical protein [Saprospiraceae bacterium]HPN68351.1 hypothetical protein [Saprospiraceae bacterium]
MKKVLFKSFLLFQFGIMILLISGCKDNHSHSHGDDDHTHSHDDAGHTHGDETHSHANGADGHTHAPSPGEQPAFTYLRMNGEFKMNPGDSLTQNDPRNPGKIKLMTTDEKGSLTKMTFYDHNDLTLQLAECGYQYMGSRPDPHYFPNDSKTSIWDIFKKVENYSGDCSTYTYVISRSPHGDPIHMHLRYGNDLEALFENSNMEKDEKFNPWWPTFCDINQKEPCG